MLWTAKGALNRRHSIHLRRIRSHQLSLNRLYSWLCFRPLSSQFPSQLFHLSDERLGLALLPCCFPNRVIPVLPELFDCLLLNCGLTLQALTLGNPQLLIFHQPILQAGHRDVGLRPSSALVNQLALSRGEIDPGRRQRLAGVRPRYAQKLYSSF